MPFFLRILFPGSPISTNVLRLTIEMMVFVSWSFIHGHFFFFFSVRIHLAFNILAFDSHILYCQSQANTFSHVEYWTDATLFQESIF